METIDAGDVPLDRVVDQLFSDVGLRKLIGHHGVACFVLARSGLAPQFYEQLIKNVDTIDATTRNHVAFIVFHGNKSSIVRRPEEGYRAYEHHLDGLSMSKGTTVWIDEYHAQPIDLKFDRELAEKIRSAPRHAPLTYISRAMDLATTILMDRFDVFETALPCLLFVDGSRIREFQVVQLSPKQPMESLYRTVLAPLSDEFRLLEAYWQHEIVSSAIGGISLKHWVSWTVSRVNFLPLINLWLEQELKPQQHAAHRLLNSAS